MSDYRQGLDDGADLFAKLMTQKLVDMEKGRELCSERGYYSRTLTFEQIKMLLSAGFTKGVISETSTGSLVEVPDAEAQGNR
jgi:hypothetical protein